MTIIADQCRYAEAVALKHGFAFEILDEGEGYLFKISDGSRSFIAGAGSLSSYPLNGAFGATAANDKVYTNKLLDRAGIPNLGGRAFFISEDSRFLRSAGYELGDAKDYFASLGGIAFCKPLKGSRGDFAEVVGSEDVLLDYIRRCGRTHAAIVIQPFFTGVEYRVFVLDEVPIFCLRKPPVEIIGDGRRDVAALIRDLNEAFSGSGVSSYPPNTPALNSSGTFVDGRFLPDAEERLTLPGRKNLSYGSVPVLVEPMPGSLCKIAVDAAGALGLRAAAIDVIAPEDGLRVIEVNANPEMKSLERLDRWDLIERIWLHVIRAGLR